MSVPRHCAVYNATDAQWHVELGEFEHAQNRDSLTYGPFPNFTATHGEIGCQSNPGGFWGDENDDEKNAVPTEIPNGAPIQLPSRPSPRRLFS